MNKQEGEMVEAGSQAGEGSATPERKTLSLWTIYDHPRDYPHCYVARRFELDQPTADHIISPSLEELRAHFISMGLACLTRDPNDAPQIVETWL